MTPGWRVLYVPQAEAIHHDQLSTDRGAMRRRIVEFHRGRDRYLRKHRSAATRYAWRGLWAWFYAVRALVALVKPGDDPSRYLTHARQALMPWRGEGVREAAEAYNRRLEAAPAR